MTRKIRGTKFLPDSKPCQPWRAILSALSTDARREGLFLTANAANPALNIVLGAYDGPLTQLEPSAEAAK